jgi:adenosylhomocysteine nucleosidase
MPKVAIVAALEREVAALTRNCRRVQREYEGRRFTFFERDDAVIVCGGIGLEAARRATHAVIALYHPAQVQSVGFAGALDASLQIGDIFTPSVVLDVRDGSRIQLDGGEGTLLSFMAVAGGEQKLKLAQAYGGGAVDMEAAAVAAAAHAHGIIFGATKVISDTLDFEMPGMARFIDPDGRFRTASFALFAALRPWLWRRVAVLANNSDKAATSLAAHLEGLLQELNNSPAHPAVPAATRLHAGGRE